MKLLVAFAIFAVAAAGVLPQNEYLPPVAETEIAASVEILSPIDVVAPLEAVAPIEEATVLADDGYRYKTVRRLKYRLRRDVNELAVNQYLPPVVPSTEYLPAGEVAAPVEDVIAPVEEVVVPVEEVAAPVEDSAVLADDGYRYKTVRRLKYRHRRDVNEIPVNQYLSPVVPSTEYLPAAEVAAPVDEVIAPVEEVVVPVEEVAAPVEESAVLADDGYRYKTVRRLKYRHRRDVNELAVNQYLPPVVPTTEYLPAAEVAVPVEEVIAPVEEVVAPVEESAAPVEESAVLADDGYRYKTVRRLKYRLRRDVNELAVNQYLPPVVPSTEYLPAGEVAAPVEDVIAPVEEVVVRVEEVAAPVEESAVLADDGYRYKTVRRLKYRHRRDVNELAVNQYLPPVVPTTEYLPAAEVAAPVEEVIAPVEEVVAPVEESAAPVEESAVLADDGYRYKTVRRLKYRHRRDVNEIPVNQYLSPVVPNTEYLPAAEVAAPVEEVIAPVEEVVAPVEESSALVEESAVLADDGYRYKTVRRLKYRHRRDVNEIPVNQYLSPVVPNTEYLPAAEVAAPVEEVIVPVEEVVVPVEEVALPVEDSAVLADDGYRYKTVRRLKYRHRRDVNELAVNQYLPPVVPNTEYLPAAEVAAPVEEVIAPVEEVVAPVEESAAPVEESAVLAADGYRYKTVRRLKYRHRRDVNELPGYEYVAPVAVAEAAAPIEEVAAPVEETVVPEDDTVVDVDGYRYKTVKKLRYRHRA